MAIWGGGMRTSASDEDLDESAEVGFYCPDCAEREFGGA
jgi:hypothetical protein